MLDEAAMYGHASLRLAMTLAARCHGNTHRLLKIDSNCQATDHRQRLEAQRVSSLSKRHRTFPGTCRKVQQLLTPSDWRGFGRPTIGDSGCTNGKPKGNRPSPVLQRDTDCHRNEGAEALESKTEPPASALAMHSKGSLRRVALDWIGLGPSLPFEISAGRKQTRSC